MSGWPTNRGEARTTGRTADRAKQGVVPTCENSSHDTTTLKPSGVSSPTSRPARGRIDRLRQRLGERDYAVLRSLHKLRLLTGAQIARLHIAGGSVGTQARRTRALLQRLAELNLVVRLGRRVGGVRAGSAGFIYGLSGYGQAVLEANGPTGKKRRRVWETSPPHQRHVLAVSELFVQLVEADRDGRVDLLEFQAEPTCWRRFPGAVGGVVTLKPDVALRLGVRAVELSVFIEVDMGTESTPTLTKKCHAYIAYWRSGIEQQAHDVFPVVLWLAGANRRVDHLREVVRKLPHETQTLFRVALLSETIHLLTAEGGEQ
ncbi:replication-relaxation family protein [Glycomyces harbinensis]|uniref:Replication-relaxation n=1 Tax=Glycomyces harbinensis TaxID=58114 RepID=A0A1G7BKI3_9ACTN|nr:replication-relaxation family protein [Glycomyces harbinensis]SDE27601.1 Replication-relaxation [Glycomyces harbinensis]